jgi:hypothetical protein
MSLNVFGFFFISLVEIFNETSQILIDGTLDRYVFMNRRYFDESEDVGYDERKSIQEGDNLERSLLGEMSNLLGEVLPRLI